MYHTGWVTEFREKLAAEGACLTRKEDQDEASPLIKRWLMLADQLLSTDGGEVEPA